MDRYMQYNLKFRRTNSLTTGKFEVLDKYFKHELYQNVNEENNLKKKSIYFQIPPFLIIYSIPWKYVILAFRST